MGADRNKQGTIERTNLESDSSFEFRVLAYRLNRRLKHCFAAEALTQIMKVQPLAATTGAEIQF